MEKLSFGNVRPCDLAWLTREQIIDIIGNTFKSVVADDNVDFTIVRSKWFVLNPDVDYLITEKDVKATVYFYITHEDFIILRGDTPEIISSYVKEAMGKDSSIIDSKEGDYKCGNHFSTILYGRNFYRIWYSTARLRRGQDGIVKKGVYHSMNSMLCGSDPKIENKTISYFSDLLIGGRVTILNQKK